MNPRNINILHEHDLPHQEEDNPFDNFDFDKLKNVILKGLPWVIGIMILINSLAFVYLRYTPAIYSSESILKLDIKSEVGVLGLQNPMEQDIKGISGEIEILKSNLFFSKVIEVVDLDISYYHPGRSHLYDERYGNSPFGVKYEYVHPSLRDRQIEIEFQNEEEFVINIENIYQGRHRFGEAFSHDMFEFLINKTQYFESQKDISDFYFVINSEMALINYFEHNVIVEPVNFNANTIKISLMDQNRFKARSLVEAIDTIYLAYTKNAKNQAGEQKISFLENQMAKTASELESFEDYFEKFTIEHRTTDLSRDLNNTIVLLNKIDSQRVNIRNKISTIELIIKQIELNESISVSGVSPEMVALISSYAELINEKKLKLSNYNENTQIIQQLEKRIELARESASSRLLALKKELLKNQEELKQKRLNLESSFVELPSMGTSYNKNRRLYSLQEEFYFSLIKSKIELEIAKAGTVTNYVILSPASFPNDPVHPKSIITFLISNVSGLFISFVFFALSYLLHDKITSIKELEKLMNAPILGMVPKYRSENLDATRLVVNKNPKSAVSESLRSIRTNLEFISSSEETQIISITSTVSGEGKTFIAVNLGAIMAYSGHKVVVVDMDMRKPKVHLAFTSEERDMGVSTILIGKHKINECIQLSEVENLSFIAAGTTPPNPSELILSPRFDDMLNELKTIFDIIILDTPPVGLVTDGVLVMKKSQIPIYVVRSGYSKKAYLKSVHKLLSNSRFRHLSVIFNSVSGESNYGYGVGKRYGSGYYEEKDYRSASDRLFKRD